MAWCCRTQKDTDLLHGWSWARTSSESFMSLPRLGVPFKDGDAVDFLWHGIWRHGKVNAPSVAYDAANVDVLLNAGLRSQE